MGICVCVCVCASCALTWMWIERQTEIHAYHMYTCRLHTRHAAAEDAGYRRGRGGGTSIRGSRNTPKSRFCVGFGGPGGARGAGGGVGCHDGRGQRLTVGPVWHARDYSTTTAFALHDYPLRPPARSGFFTTLFPPPPPPPPQELVLDLIEPKCSPPPTFTSPLKPLRPTSAQPERPAARQAEARSRPLSAAHASKARAPPAVDTARGAARPGAFNTPAARGRSARLRASQTTCRAVPAGSARCRPTRCGAHLSEKDGDQNLRLPETSPAEIGMSAKV